MTNNYQIKTGILSAVFFTLTLSPIFGQRLLLDYKFHTCSPEGGFYYDGVKSIQQDLSGFIWILMDNDLYRFDGYQYVSYYRFFQQLDASVKWKFNFIETDTLGRLYVVANNRLFVHHAHTNHFEQLLDSTVGFLKIDTQNHIWLKTPDLHLYRPESGRLTPIMYNDQPFSDISTFWNDDNQLYAASTEGIIYQLDPENGKCVKHGNLPAGNRYPHIVWRDKTIWACSDKNKLYQIDSENYNTIEIYDFLDTPENYVNTLYVDQSQNVGIGTRRGLYVLNPQTGKQFLFLHRRNDHFSIPNNSVLTINEDRQENVWIGTYSGGLCYVNPKQKTYFKSYSTQEIAGIHPIISGFAETGNEWWLATDGGGINIMDKKTETFSYLKNEPGKNSLAYNHLKTMVMDSARENIWISMLQGGLDCYHIPTQTFTHYKHDPQNENSLQFNNLRKIVQEADSGIWIAYQFSELLFSYF